MEDYKGTNWYRYMEEPMRDLAAETYSLLQHEEDRLQGSGEPRHDYAFVVFPLAKAYEGFLKKMFLDMGLISRKQYKGEYFRIGKALNPSLPKRLRFGWVFGKLVTWCGGREELPLRLWEAWKRARNRIFHFFPDHHEFITLEEAKSLIADLQGAMEEAVRGCRLTG